MPFARFTLVNRSDRNVDVRLRLDVATARERPDEAAGVAAAHSRRTVKKLQCTGVVKAIKAASEIRTPGDFTLHPKGDLGGRPGDDILEAIVLLDPARSSGKTISALIANRGTVRWETTSLR